MIETKKGFKLDLKNIEEIIDEVKKPSSLNELSRKFGLPLTVKCVKEFYNIQTGEAKGLVGKILTYKGKLYDDYWESEELGDHSSQNPDSKKFILWEKE